MEKAFPPANDFANFISEIDYVKLGNDVIKHTATVAAIVVGVISYLYTAFQLWWNDNGETVKVNLFRFIVNMIDFIAFFVGGCIEVYGWVKLNTNRLVDSLFFNYIFA